MRSVFRATAWKEISVIEHSGGFYGVSSQVFYLPEQGYAIVILSNNDFGAPPVFDRFISYMTGRETYSPVSSGMKELSRYAGFYEIVQGEMKGKKLKISVKKDHLIFDNELEFYPYAEYSFFDIDNETSTLQFVKDSDGSLIGFIWTGGHNFTAKAKPIKESEMPGLTKIDLDNRELAEYPGKFQFGESGMMPGRKPEITVKDGALLIDGRMRFVPFSKDKFYLQDDKQMQLHFIRNEANEITGFHVRRGEELLGEVLKLN